jgi:hypothetical protein
MSEMLLSERIQMKATAKWGKRVVLLGYGSSRVMYSEPSFK